MNAQAEYTQSDLQRLLTELTLSDDARSALAASELASLAREREDLLNPLADRLISIAGAAEAIEARRMLAEALPRLALGARRAGRLAFVFESWLDASDPALQRAALDGLLALVAQRPALASRLRSQIEIRSARGAPVITRHGRSVLERLREF